MKDGIFSEYWDLACQVVEQAELDGRRVTTSLLANDLYAQIDPKSLSPAIVEYGARQFCVQILGRVCRDKWGTTNDPLGERFKGQLEFKEFGTRLQARYPVSFGSLNGETEYKHIDALSDIEGRKLCNRLSDIGHGYQEHSDQLRRYLHRIASGEG